MANVAIVFHSGYGHTKAVAESVQKGAASVAGSNVTLVSVTDAEQHWDTLAKADAIIFGAPTYMGSVSADMKKFMEASSKVWFTQGWKDKIAAGFTNSAGLNGDKARTIDNLFTLAMQHAMIWVSQGLMPANTKASTRADLNNLVSYAGAIAQSPSDAGAQEMAAGDLETAKVFGQRVADIAGRFKR